MSNLRGWIKNTGECPVPDGQMIDVRYNDGKVCENIPANAAHGDRTKRNAIGWQAQPAIPSLISHWRPVCSINGWHKWVAEAGAKCPVGTGNDIQVKLADGGMFTHVAPERLTWDDTIYLAGRIVAWRYYDASIEYRKMPTSMPVDGDVEVDMALEGGHKATGKAKHVNWGKDSKCEAWKLHVPGHVKYISASKVVQTPVEEISKQEQEFEQPAADNPMLETTTETEEVNDMNFSTQHNLNGTNIDNLSDEQIYSRIADAEAGISSLSKIGHQPKSLKKKIKDIKKNLKNLVAFLDARDGGDGGDGADDSDD